MFSKKYYQISEPIINNDYKLWSLSTDTIAACKNLKINGRKINSFKISSHYGNFTVCEHAGYEFYLDSSLIVTAV
jgi:hypothetical protein